MPVLTAMEAEKLLLKAGYVLLRTKGSHKIYSKGDEIVVIPFHRGKTLNRGITQQVLEAVQQRAEDE